MTRYFSSRLIGLGYRRAKQGLGIRLDDLWELSDENKTEAVISKFLPRYEAEMRNKGARPSKNKNEDGTPIVENKTNVIIPLFKTFGWNLMGIAFIKLITSLLTFVSPSVLNALITFVQTPDGEW